MADYDNLVSVIIPVYNTSEYLPFLFNSLLNQTYKNFEIVFVDNGSNDNSAELLEKFFNDNQPNLNIKIITLKDNVGPGNARNIGIDNSSGEFLTFIDADDAIAPNHLEVLVGLIKKQEGGYFDLAVSNYTRSEKLFKKLVNEKSDKKIKNRIFNVQGYTGFVKSIFEFETTCFNSYSILWACPWCKLYRTDIIKTNNIKFNDEFRSCSEDMVFLFDYCKYVKTFSATKLKTLYWRKVKNSLTNTHTAIRHKGYIRAEKYVFENTKNEPDWAYFVSFRVATRVSYPEYFALKTKVFLGNKDKNNKEFVKVFDDFILEYYEVYKKGSFKSKHRFLAWLLLKVMKARYMFNYRRKHIESCDGKVTDYEIAKKIKHENGDGVVIIKVRFCNFCDKPCAECSEFDACNKNEEDNSERCNEYGNMLNNSREGEQIEYNGVKKEVDFHLGIDKYDEINTGNPRQHKTLPCRYLYFDKDYNGDLDIGNLEIWFFGEHQKLSNLKIRQITSTKETLWDYEVDMNENTFKIKPPRSKNRRNIKG